MTIAINDQTSQKDSERQQELGITCDTVQIYRYKTHVYQKLTDALKYAELDSLRENPDADAPVENPIL